MFGLVSAIATFSAFVGTAASSPVVAPLDQASETVLVGNVHGGAATR